MRQASEFRLALNEMSVSVDVGPPPGRSRSSLKRCLTMWDTARRVTPRPLLSLTR